MQFQVEILLFLQSIRTELLNIIFLLFTISTELPVVILFTSVLYWCVDKSKGQKMLFSLIGSIAINSGIKNIVKAQRPIGIEGLESMRESTATGYSFPSGHTQTATTFWTNLIILFRNKKIYICGILVALAVGISRVYLGVHWPIDVLFGWIFGIICSLLFINIFDKIDKTKNYKLLLIINVLFIGALVFIEGETYMKTVALMTGFSLGYIFEDKYIQFETFSKKTRQINFSTKKRNKSNTNISVYRMIIGLATLGIVYIIMKYMFMVIGMMLNIDSNMYILDFMRYTIVVFYAVAGVPMLFEIFKLNYKR